MIDEMTTQGKVVIERMSLAHLDEVMAIEIDSFISPWSGESFKQEIHGNKTAVALVASIDSRIIGYIVAWHVADEIHIGNIAVHRNHRRKGIGELLMQYLLDRGREQKCSLATLEVRPKNGSAIELYRKFGFLPVAIRRGYYPETGEDAIVMMKNFGSETSPVDQVRSDPDNSREGVEWNGLRKQG